jgi:hypothetical protein
MHLHCMKREMVCCNTMRNATDRVADGGWWSVLGTAGTGCVPDRIDSAKGYSDPDGYTTGTAEAGSRQQTGVDHPEETT